MAEFHPSDSDVLGLKYSLAGGGEGAGRGRAGVEGGGKSQSSPGDSNVLSSMS